LFEVTGLDRTSVSLYDAFHDGQPETGSRPGPLLPARGCPREAFEDAREHFFWETRPLVAHLDHGCVCLPPHLHLDNRTPACVLYGIADEVVDNLVETTCVDGSCDVGVGVER
jgi:hypothetical protein